MRNPSRQRSLPARKHRNRAAFSLIEVMVAGVILAIAAAGIASSMVASMALSRVNRETQIAQSAAQRVIEEARGIPFNEVFATYNATNADDGGLTVAARGPSFDVRDLDVVPGDPDGRCGQVIFPTSGPPEQLREDVVDAGLGMPRDLDYDGVIDGADHKANYTLLPIRVRVQWRGVSGVRTFDLETALCLH
jgi:prepilin-type N-terminal cleavage/methylation domain-containing protein